MSRIGKKPIEIAKGVTATVNGQEVAVKGPKGELKLTLVDDVTVSQGEGGITVAPREDTQRARAMWVLPLRDRSHAGGARAHQQPAHQHEVRPDRHVPTDEAAGHDALDTGIAMAAPSPSNSAAANRGRCSTNRTSEFLWRIGASTTNDKLVRFEAASGRAHV